MQQHAPAHSAGRIRGGDPLYPIPEHLLFLPLQYFQEAVETWERTQRPPDNRSCKYCASALMNVFGLPALAVNVAADTLRNFITTMLLTLIDARVSHIQEGEHLMKACYTLYPFPYS